MLKSYWLALAIVFFTLDFGVQSYELDSFENSEEYLRFLQQNATCNVQKRPPGDALPIIRTGGFSQYSEEQLRIIRFAELEGDSIRLSSNLLPNAVTAFWFAQQERLTDGFRVEFSFTYDAGTADGFGLVIQDDRVQDVFGDGGEALGFEDVFPNYLAIGFDFCSDRPDCTEQSVRIDTRSNNEASTTVDSNSGVGVFGELVDEAITVQVRVDYLADVHEVHVFINPDEEPLDFLRAEVDLSAILNTEFAHIGFSGSNSNSGITNVKALNLAINNFELTQMNSGFLMTSDSLLAQRVDRGELVLFEFDVVDSCNVPDGNASLIDPSSIFAVLQDRDRVGNRLVPTNIARVGSTVTLTFITTATVSANYDLTIQVDGVLVQANPLLNIVSAQPPVGEAGLPPGAVAAIISSILLLFLILILYAGRGYFRYKEKLDEHEEDIEYGKTKEQIDAIDETIDYHMNPLVAPLDKLKERLAKNLQYIKDIKAGQQNALDSEFTVEQLHAENEELRRQIQELKKEEEFANAGKAMSVEDDDEDVFIPPPKMEFEEEENVGQEDDELDDEEVEATVMKALSKNLG